MSERPTDQIDFVRTQAIHRYVDALDRGDIDGIDQVLEAAMHDSELSRIIEEINLEYQDQDQLTPIAADAQLVRDLLQQHLSSAFDINEPDETPLTVGQVAARLHAERRVPVADQEANRRLVVSSVPLPTWLSAQAVRQLAMELGVAASDRFWRMFRDTAITLGMGQSHKSAQLAAAREERARYRVRQPDTHDDAGTEIDTELEEPNQ